MPDQPLPPAPSSGSPWLFWSAVADGALYGDEVPDANGLKVRLSVLFGALAYVALAALLCLFLALLDSRRRQKSLWLWKLTTRYSGRFIVGNGQLLEPLLTLLVTAIFIGHIVNEWSVLFNRASQASTSAWRIAPWTVLLVQQWILSWASLQGFIIASGDLHPAIAWLTPMRVNVAFILVGSLSTTALVVIDIIVARASVSMWDDYRQLQAFLLVANGRWTEGALNTADVQLATVYWNDWLDHLSRIVNLVIPLLCTFATIPLLTLLVNLGSFGLFGLVRKQIHEGYGDFGAEVRRESSGDAAMLSNRSISVLPQRPEDGRGQPDDVPAPISVSFSSMSAQAIAEKSVAPEDIDTSHIGRDSFHPAAPPPAVAAAAIVSADESARRRSSGMPSRAAVRRLAFDAPGTAMGEKARRLAQLQRAESDLLLTGISSSVLSTCFATLSIWTCVVYRDISEMPWFAREATYLLGTYAYAIIGIFTLTTRCYLTAVSMSRRKTTDASSSRKLSLPDSLAPLTSMVQWSRNNSVAAQSLAPEALSPTQTHSARMQNAV